MDMNGVNVNFRTSGIVIVVVFILIGLFMYSIEIKNDFERQADRLYNIDNAISKSMMVHLNSYSSYLKTKVEILQYSKSSFLTANSQEWELVETNDESWIIKGHNEDGDVYYAFGNEGTDAEGFEYGEERTNHSLNTISTIMKNVKVFNNSTECASLIYTSDENDFDMIYPIGKSQKRNNTQELYKHLNEFKSLDLDNRLMSDIINNKIYIWEKFMHNGYLNYIGVGINNCNDLIVYPANIQFEQIYLYTDDQQITLFKGDEVSEAEDTFVRFVPKDYMLHEEKINGNIYHYRQLTDDIVYLSKTSESIIMRDVLVDNNMFIIVIVLTLISLVVFIFFLQNYKKYVELEMETKEQELKKSIYKSRLGHVMNTISEAFVRADSSYKILEINKAAAEMMGYHINELLGRQVMDFLTRPLEVKLRKNEGLYNCYEVSLIKKDGSIVYGLVNKSTVVKEKPMEKEHFIMISDITELIEARRKAEEANESKSNFIANLSHEIRTPMNSTIGYVYLLEQTNLTKQQKKYLERMDYAANTLLEIIDEILDFSKIEADQVRIENIPFRLHSLIVNAVSMFENTAYRKNIQLKTKIGDDVPQCVVSDPHRIRQVMINILSNAFKFTEEGEISIIAELLEEKSADRAVIKISVRDTGIGINGERIDMLFNPFVQADDSTTRIYGGTGLGLAICRRLVGLMDGRIYASSEEHIGSTFSFEIPVSICSEKTLEEQSLPANKLFNANSDKKILIVEDNPLNQELMVELLRQKGNRVVVANHGKLAETILTKEHKEPFDIILMDIQMPVQDGYTTTEFIRNLERYKSIPIIAVTANADGETRHKLEKSGMNDFIVKPIIAQDLFEKIEKWK